MSTGTKIDEEKDIGSSGGKALRKMNEKMRNFNFRCVFKYDVERGL